MYMFPMEGCTVSHMSTVLHGYGFLALRPRMLGLLCLLSGPFYYNCSLLHRLC